jgi:hypothetical protein
MRWFGGLCGLCGIAWALVSACSSDNSASGSPGSDGGTGGNDGATSGDDGFSPGSDSGGGNDSSNPGPDSGGPDAPQESGTTSFPAGTICNNSGTARTAPTTIKHVITIIFENKDYASVMGHPDAPYMNSIKDQCGYTQNYLDTCFTDDLASEPHYLALTSGSNCDTGLDQTGTNCITDDADPGSHTLAASTVLKQATSWKAYIEDMGTACNQSSGGEYACKHNPSVFYTEVAASCATNDVSIPSVTCPDTTNTTCTGSTTNAFTQDLTNDTLPAYGWITPNLTNDMHDGSVKQGDNWLHTYLPLILASPAYLRGEVAVHVLWDEQGTFTSGATPNFFVSPYIQPTASTTTVNHFSDLRTIEEQLGISTYLGCAGGTPPGGSGTCPTGSSTSMRGIFNF